MPKLNKVIPAGDEAFVMQIHPKSLHRVVHLMGETLQMQHLSSCLEQWVDYLIKIIKIWHKEI